MSTASDRVRALVREGKLEADEAGELLSAVGTKDVPSSGALAMLLNPFDRLGGGRAACIGVVVALACFAATRLGIRFDGFLDIHTGLVSTKIAAIEQAVDWIVPSLTFFAVARVLGSRARLLDTLGMCGLARVPYALSAPLLGLLVPHAAKDPAIRPIDIPILVIVLCALAVQIYWLVRGYQNASGFTKTKLTVSFLFGFILAEILSKVCISTLS